MSPAALVTLNMRELDRLKVIQAVVDIGLEPGRGGHRAQARACRRATWPDRASGRAAGSAVS
ncbi:hypothetical protein OKW40_000673 [Paraburkholderia sp. RAU6.4a]|uniref:hypothetical protein n=1 Tax=unclassified Paraburkholderia TaxID=2615204 RepID=UPI0017A7F92C|nr:MULTISPECIES: hypothetical protein [unclassified Paraburkholderia]MBB5407499.1 hypothetical protein [Paraburkholderia sp. HC6.4b]MBB5453744.1 hypothetical protein [Paraburkholderia sp. Kb1A]